MNALKVVTGFGSERKNPKHQRYVELKAQEATLRSQSDSEFCLKIMPVK